MRRALRVAPAVLLAGAGVLALLLARDVQHRQASFRADDIRFRTAPADDLWRPSQLVPFGTATALLGVRDDLAYRRALQTLRLGTPRRLVFASPPALALRAEAQLKLARIAQTDADPARRSAAENFLGGLSFAAAAEDPESRDSLLEGAAAVPMVLCADLAFRVGVDLVAGVGGDNREGEPSIGARPRDFGGTNSVSVE